MVMCLTAGSASFSLIFNAQSLPRIKNTLSRSAPGTGKDFGVTPELKINLSYGWSVVWLVA